MSTLSSYSGRNKYTVIKKYTTPGTYTWRKPWFAREIIVICIGGGGQGGGGCSGISSIYRFGGSGGGGGARVQKHFLGKLVSSRVTVTVGAGGTGAGTGGASPTNGGNGVVHILAVMLVLVAAVVVSASPRALVAQMGAAAAEFFPHGLTLVGFRIEELPGQVSL